MNINTVICGDCLVVLKQFNSNSVDCVVTSPPYFQQRDYNGVGVGRENGFTNYIDSLLEVFDEIVRVVKPTGNILYNIGDKINKDKGVLLVPYRFALKALDREVQLVNSITWVKKNPTPRQYNRRLVSATEPFFHFTKGDDYYYSLDDYMPTEKLKTHDPSSKLGQKYFLLIDHSTLTERQKSKARQEVMQVIEEVKNKQIVGFRVKIKGIHAPAFGGQEGGRQLQMDKQGYTIIRLKGNPIKKDYIETAVESLRTSIKHPAVYPLNLVEQLISLTCPLDGVVLDPYCGSGTTLVAAQNKKRKYIGIEISPQYCCLAEERLKI